MMILNNPEAPFAIWIHHCHPLVKGNLSEQNRACDQLVL